MAVLNEVMYKFAELLGELPTNKMEPTPVELLPNKASDLEISNAQFFTETSLNSTAAAKKDDLAVLREKKRAHEPDDMVQKAHPKSVFVMNSLGDGGLVENDNERQEKIVQMINKMPTGDHIHTYAGLIEDLVKVADFLDDKLMRPDLAKEADEILKGFIK